jgi:hypothetical protein
MSVKKRMSFFVKNRRFWGKIALKMTQNVPFQTQKQPQSIAPGLFSPTR